MYQCTLTLNPFLIRDSLCCINEAKFIGLVFASYAVDSRDIDISKAFILYKSVTKSAIKNRRQKPEIPIIS